jgi:nitrogen-specific signal transduction histidine kinase
MLSDSELIVGQKECNSVTFNLNSDLQVCRFSAQAAVFAGCMLNGNEFFAKVLPIHNPEILKALSAAVTGRSASARFQIENQNNNYYLELYCLPDHDNSGEISCFLLDKTVDEARASRLQAKIYILDIISQAVRAFAETRNLSEILRIILLGVTAGPGLGFNRGFILLSNEARTFLWGCLATGPSTPEEAGIIWQNMASRSLSFEETLRLYKSSTQSSEDAQINSLVASLKIPLTDDSNFISQAVKEGRSIITSSEIMDAPISRELVEKFGTDCMAVIPLISREGLQGVLLADNLITGKPIKLSDLRVLEIFARYASDAIENSRLYGRLEQQICRLKEANEQIIKSRENLIKAEKLSSVAKMALEVAHEIRNPLTVIGGYANALLRKIGPDDSSKKIIDIISRQATRIENALDRFSSVVSLSEKKEGRFNLPSLIRDTLSMLSSSASPDLPVLVCAESAENTKVFTDQGLFRQAMMVIFRKAAETAGGMLNISVKLEKSGQSGIIFILGSDNCLRFAEEFYRSIRDSKGDLKNQEIAVALEILQHYGGGIGVISEENKSLRLYVEFPLCKEEV